MPRYDIIIMEDKMEKKDNKEKKLTSKQKELIITIVVLVLSIVIGFFIGKYLFEVMY